LFPFVFTCRVSFRNQVQVHADLHCRTKLEENQDHVGKDEQTTIRCQFIEQLPLREPGTPVKYERNILMPSTRSTSLSYTAVVLSHLALDCPQPYAATETTRTIFGIFFPHKNRVYGGHDVPSMDKKNGKGRRMNENRIRRTKLTDRGASKLIQAHSQLATPHAHLQTATPHCTRGVWRSLLCGDSPR
jgi:hypothetical protein